MKRVFSRISKKALVSALAVAGIIGVSAVAVAWSPARPTYTIEQPAPHVTFNSITNNPNYGDERTFYDVKDASNTNPGGFVDNIKVKDGQTLLVRAYVHNNAADNLNTIPDGNGGFKGIARDTKVRIHLPTASAKALRSNAYVSASNATPGEVADTVDFHGDSEFTLEYIPGSARTVNNVHLNGTSLSDNIVTTGAPLGYQQNDGKVPGCFQYANIVTIKVKVKMPTPKYTVSKKVAVAGGQWSENVTAKPGETVSYLIGFNNTGSSQLANVAIRDKLPAHMSIVPGTTKITNPNNPNGVDAGTDAVVTSGIDIGTYNPGSNAYVTFKAKIADAKDLKCGLNKLHNVAEAFKPGDKPVTDSADVEVNKECKDVPNYVCEALKVSVGADRTVTITEFKQTSSNGATFKHARINWGDNTDGLFTNPVGQKHQYKADSNYKITATAVFNVGDETKEATSASCAQTVSFTPPTTPSELPKTGAGDVIGIFAATTVAGAMAHRYIYGRKYQ